MKNFFLFIFALFLSTFTEALSESIWEKIPGPLGGPIYDITSDTNGKLYALHGYEGSIANPTIEPFSRIWGVYISADTGKSWTYRYLGGAVSSFCKIYCFDGQYLTIPAEQGQMYVSGNGWETWVIDEIYNIKNVTTMFVTSDKVKYAALGNYLYRKWDNGEWNSLRTLFDIGAYVTDFIERNSGEIIISSAANRGDGGAGLYKTTNYGKDWTKLENADELIETYLLENGEDSSIIAASAQGLFLLPKNKDKFEKWLAKEDFGITGKFKALSMLKNGNKSWLVSIENEGIYKIVDSKIQKLTDFILPIHFKAMHRFGGAIFGCSEHIGMFKSDDNGESWQPCNKGMGSIAVESLYKNSKETVFIAATGGNLYRKGKNDDDWANIKTGAEKSSIYKMIETQNGNLLLLSGSNVYLSSNDGVEWLDVWRFGTQLFSPKMEISPNGHVFVSDLFGTCGLLKSSDGGKSWIQATDNQDLKGVIDFVFDSSGNCYLFDYDERLFVSRDDGRNWSFLNTFRELKISTQALAGFFYNSKLFFVCSAGLFYLDDKSNTFVNTDLMTTELKDFGEILGGAFFVKSTIGLYRSWNGVKDWMTIESPEDTDIKSLCLMEDGTLLAGTYSGIYKSKTRNEDIKFLQMDVSPGSPELKYYGDSVVYEIYVHDDRGITPDDAVVFVRDTLFNIEKTLPIINNKAEYKVLIPPGTHSGQYFIDFKAFSPTYHGDVSKSVILNIGDYANWDVKPDTLIYTLPGSSIKLDVKVTTRENRNVFNAQVLAYHVEKPNKYVLSDQKYTDIYGKTEIEYILDNKHRFGLDSLLLKAYHTTVFSAASSNTYPYKVYFYVVNPASAEQELSGSHICFAAPNPAGDYCKLFFKSVGQEYVSLTLSDIFGRAVFEQGKITTHEGLQDIYIDTSNLPMGTYIARIATGKELKTIKISVVK